VGLGYGSQVFRLLDGKVPTDVQLSFLLRARGGGSDVAGEGEYLR
jgi:hypothetical protein